MLYAGTDVLCFFIIRVQVSQDRPVLYIQAYN